ncbi:MAG: hypothetical protein CVT70_02975 [Alphaproteobacteria bacterium HGW-Alphaproteobacteria-1]|jgi:hypothetical protein|nr:MAG: hypothetical protein CVT70_02975 [Alphaproteobacteria bacterium HGW-Alphaproteobacteria-1]
MVMMIDKIEIRDLRHDGSITSAVVICQTQTGQVSILASVPATENPAPDLVAEALRQLQRMPGFRCGTRALVLAPDAKIEITTRA